TNVPLTPKMNLDIIIDSKAIRGVYKESLVSFSDSTRHCCMDPTCLQLALCCIEFTVYDFGIAILLHCHDSATGPPLQ
ncbi:MAG: hypothetical protein ACKPKO_56240, partial [Candidatus Fonsibacter sp.]